MSQNKPQFNVSKKNKSKFKNKSIHDQSKPKNTVVKYLVIGAGPTGCGTAIRLVDLYGRDKDLSSKIKIIDKDVGPGGLSRSFKVNDKHGNKFYFDKGGHVLFSHYEYFDNITNKAVDSWNTLNRCAVGFMKTNNKQPFLPNQKGMVPYPIQNSIHYLPNDLQKVIINDIKQHTNLSVHSFAEWGLVQFGPSFCDFFFYPYNIKVWTMHPRDMSNVWVNDRVTPLDKNKIKIRSPDYKCETDTGWGPNKTFKFPQVKSSMAGTQLLWEGIYKMCPSNIFEYETKAEIIDWKQRIVKLNNNKQIMYDNLINTMPLDILLNKLTPTPPDKIMAACKQLEHNQTFVFGIGLKSQTPEWLKNKSWCYFPDDDIPIYRATIFSNYSKYHVPNDKFWSIMAEFNLPASMKVNDALANQKLQETIDGLIAYGWIKSADEIVAKNYQYLEYGYPIPTVNRDNALAVIIPWLEEQNIYSRGRFGGWKYEVGNQDHCFMQGVEIIDYLEYGAPETTYNICDWTNSTKRLGRKNIKLLDPNIDLEIVVARYSENVSWLKGFQGQALIHVYNKGLDFKSFISGKYLVERLPNIGRESHTYLSHIVKYYHQLSDITIFTQGAHDDDGWSTSDLLWYSSQLLSSKQEKFASYGLDEIDMIDRIQYGDPWLEDIRSGKLKTSRYTFAEVYKRYILNDDEELPESFVCSYKGCFAVTKEAILQHPRTYYQDLLDLVSDHRNPEEGHYIERMWATIFNKDLLYYDYSFEQD